MEYVGMAELDETCWRGEPGGKEPVGMKELLRLVQAWPEEKLGQKIAEKKDWNVLYHLSAIRGNLVEWLPIEKTDCVLEIGSECGALTVTLAKKAGYLDCIEESKAKSMVNATRNQNNEHVSIKIGNFFDVEHRLRGQYDWVIVAGMPDYAKEPADFLRRAAALLKAGGHLVLATENRLGLKYFAGCAEEHTGRLFEGIEGFRHREKASTFSKPELEKLFCEAGFYDWSFYYPYPDYKLPMSIYSDEYLPKLGELRTNQNNFDFRRLQLFDESEAFDGIIQSGLFPIFSNSFLVIVSCGGVHE